MKRATSRRLRRAARTALHWLLLPLDVIASGAEKSRDVARKRRERRMAGREEAEVIDLFPDYHTFRDADFGAFERETQARLVEAFCVARRAPLSTNRVVVIGNPGADSVVGRRLALHSESVPVAVDLIHSHRGEGH